MRQISDNKYKNYPLIFEFKNKFIPLRQVFFMQV